MNELLEKIKAADQKQIYMLLGGVALAVLLIDVLFFMRLQIGGIVNAGTEAADLKKEIASLTDNVARMAQFRSNLERIRKDYSRIEERVHAKDAVPSVLRTITTVANEYGVKIAQLVPQTQSQKEVVTSKEGSYHALSIYVSANAGYHELGRFLADLENKKLFWKLDEFHLSAVGADMQKHSVRMLVKILVFEK